MGNNGSLGARSLGAASPCVLARPACSRCSIPMAMGGMAPPGRASASRASRYRLAIVAVCHLWLLMRRRRRHHCSRRRHHCSRRCHHRRPSHPSHLASFSLRTLKACASKWRTSVTKSSASSCAPVRIYAAPIRRCTRRALAPPYLFRGRGLYLNRSQLTAIFISTLRSFPWGRGAHNRGEAVNPLMPLNLPPTCHTRHGRRMDRRMHMPYL